MIDDLAAPLPAPGQALIRVKGAGVGPWDALIREHKSAVDAPLPLILGSDLSGVVEAVGPASSRFRPGDAIYGVTNAQFIGAYAELALVSTNRIAHKPEALDFLQAASAPVVAVTAWQMLFDYAKAAAGQRVLVLGAGGNVGAYAVQFAAQAGLDVFATASAEDVPYVRKCGAATVFDSRQTRFEDVVPPVEIVLDMVGGDTRKRSHSVMQPGGILVSVVSEPVPDRGVAGDFRSVFFLVEVTTERLNRLSELFDRRKLVPRVGTVLPLEQARAAHEMLAGAPHAAGKIVLKMEDHS